MTINDVQLVDGWRQYGVHFITNGQTETVDVTVTGKTKRLRVSDTPKASSLSVRHLSDDSYLHRRIDRS